MAQKPNDKPEDFEVQSNFPDSNEPALNAKIAGMVRVFGIEQSPQEFVGDLEGDLVASVNKAARIGAKQKIPPQATTSVNDEDNIPPLNQYPIEEQEKIVAKKLKVYRKTQENIKKEITRLLAIFGNKELSPTNANKINRLISNMRSLDDRMALYTKKDEAFQKQRQQQEQRMLQQNKKKKLEEKVKKQKKKIKEAESAQDREGIASFLLPGKWLEIYKKNEQSRINEMNSNLSKDQEALQKLEKATAPKAPEKQPRTPPPAQAQQVVQTKDAPVAAQAQKVETPDKKVRPPGAVTQEPLFADLFGKPEIKGKPAPDSLSGKVMQQVEQARDQKFADSQQTIRRQEARQGSKNTKK